MNPSRRPRTIRPLPAAGDPARRGRLRRDLGAIRFARGSPPVPSLSINNVTLTEGDAGTLTATFTVTQSGRGKSSVRFATAADTASSPARLPGEERDAAVRRRAQEEQGRDHHRRRHARRSERDVLRSPERCRRRDDRGRPGHWDHHRQRRATSGVVGRHPDRPGRATPETRRSPRSTSRCRRRVEGTSPSTSRRSTGPPRRAAITT